MEHNRIEIIQTQNDCEDRSGSGWARPQNPAHSIAPNGEKRGGRLSGDATNTVTEKPSGTKSGMSPASERGPSITQRRQRLNYKPRCPDSRHSVGEGHLRSPIRGRPSPRASGSSDGVAPAARVSWRAWGHTGAGKGACGAVKWAERPLAAGGAFDPRDSWPSYRRSSQFPLLFGSFACFFSQRFRHCFIRFILRKEIKIVK